MATRVLQLTDLHLFADPNARLKGVSTRDSFVDVLRFIESREDEFDVLVLTGDLAHDEELETYRMLRELLSDWISRCRLIPGNHESRSMIRRTFPELFQSEGNRLTFSFATGGWRLIGLDSHVHGQVAGRIETEQLDWLRQQLTTYADEPTVLFLHHPPVSVQSKWLDEIGLEEPQPLIETISGFKQVKVVCAGHVHQEFHGRLAQAEFYTTPSTAIQFVPRGDDLMCDHLPPGYRVLTLEGATFQTEVVRLPELKHPPIDEVT